MNLWHNTKRNTSYITSIYWKLQDYYVLKTNMRDKWRYATTRISDFKTTLFCMATPTTKIGPVRQVNCSSILQYNLQLDCAWWGATKLEIRLPTEYDLYTARRKRRRTYDVDYASRQLWNTLHRIQKVIRAINKHILAYCMTLTTWERIWGTNAGTQKRHNYDFLRQLPIIKIGPVH